MSRGDFIGFDFDLSGFKRKLRKFDKKTGERVLRPAVTALTRVVRDHARKRLPVKWKRAKTWIRSRVVKGRGSSKRHRVKIGFSVGMTRMKQEAEGRKVGAVAHWSLRSKPGVGIGPKNMHWMQLGTAERRHGPNSLWGPGWPTGRVRPESYFWGFMGKSLRNSRTAAVAAFRRKFREKYRAAYKKYVRKAGRKFVRKTNAAIRRSIGV